MLQLCLFLQMTLLAVLFLLPFTAQAMPTINVSFAGNNSYVVSGSELENVGRLELAVSYNSLLLTNPGLKSRNSFAGAAVALDTDYSGNLNLTVISSKPIQGKGAFATITFDPIGSSPGFIDSVTGRMYTAAGAQVPTVSYTVTNPTAPLDPSDPDDIPMIREREAKGQSFMGGDVSYLPPDGQEPEITAQQAEAATASGENAAASAPEGAESAGEEKVAAAEQSVLERFRLFQGERSAKKLTALFDPPPGASFRQEPPIVIADGKGTARVSIGQVAGDKTPNFTFSSARYVSFHRVSGREWLVEAKPEQGVSSAEIVILCGGKVRRIPLTVTPAARVDITAPGTVTEADFEIFLKERGSASAPKYDLNGDGKRDYLDDYIFTANYLLATEKEKAKATAEAKKHPASRTAQDAGRPGKAGKER
jgi:hypothetical protein